MNKTNIKLPGMDDYFVQEAFNVLRTNIQFCGQDVKAIAVTSSGMNEGKTVLSLHLARRLSEIGKRVLAIDADMRKSVMAVRNADAKNAKGLSEVLTGQEKLQDCIYQTQYPKMHVLFAGTYPPNPVELLNDKYFEALMNAAKNAYDYILVDTPPLGMVIDAAVIASKCDSAIMIIGSNHVRYTVAQDVVNQLEKSGCNVLGVVLNNADRGRKSYYNRKKDAYKYGYRRRG